MKKFIAFLLCLTILLSFTACSGNNRSERNGDNYRADGELEIRFSDPDLRSESEKQELMDQYGTPFYIRRTFGMQLIIFTFDEAGVLREHMDSMKDGTETHNASWDVIDGELIISGEWNESFTLDLENSTATSKSDNEVYRIVQGE
jgi:hypothetical protein